MAFFISSVQEGLVVISVATAKLVSSVMACKAEVDVRKYTEPSLGFGFGLVRRRLFSR